MADGIRKRHDSYNDKSNEDWQTILDDERWQAIWKDWQDNEERQNDKN